MNEVAGRLSRTSSGGDEHTELVFDDVDAIGVDNVDSDGVDDMDAQVDINISDDVMSCESDEKYKPVSMSETIAGTLVVLTWDDEVVDAGVAGVLRG